MSSQKGGKLLIEKAFSKLTLKEDALQHEINEAAFRIFQCVSDHGYFSWKPQRGKPKYKNLSNISSTKEIVDYIDLEARPDRLVPMSSLRLPLEFPSLPPRLFENTFPFGQNETSHLYVATRHRGIKLENIDFCFGGSALEMLARKDASNPYIVMKIPGEKSTIIVAKRKAYTQDLSDVGYQFERFVTGNNLSARYDVEFIEHLHVMKIGDYNVLFCAETDAVDENDNPVEVKASNPKYWGTKVMFQMICSGSSKLCHGVKIRGNLQSVTLKSLSSIAKEALRDRDIRVLEKNILDGMTAIRDQVHSTTHTGETGFKVHFSPGGDLELIHCKATRSTALLPPGDIVRSLLHHDSQ